LVNTSIPHLCQAHVNLGLGFLSFITILASVDFMVRILF
jgi:hypothetical protein